MAGLLGNRFIAMFHNKRGDHLFNKCFDTSLKMTKKTIFDTDDGAYFVSGSPIKFSPFPFLFDYYLYSYELHNPNPIKQSKFRPPVMNAKDFRSVLKTEILEKLLAVRKKGFGELFTLKNIIIAGAVILIVYYFASGGSLTGALDTVNNQIKPMSGGVS